MSDPTIESSSPDQAALSGQPQSVAVEAKAPQVVPSDHPVTQTTEAPTAHVENSIEPNTTTVGNLTGAVISSNPQSALIDQWFSDHFTDQTLSRESAIWMKAHDAKEKLKELLDASMMPAFPGLIDQWFWDSFANSEFSQDVNAWNLAYEAKQKLKFLLASR